MLYGLTESDVKRLQSILSWWDRFGPAGIQQASRKRSFVDRRCKGQLTATLHSSATSGKVDNIKLICGVSPTTSSTATVTAYNPDGLTGADNEWINFQWVISSTRGSTNETSTIKGSSNDIGAWEFIAMDSPDLCIGKLDGSLSYGGSATVSVWTEAAGSEADSGNNITAYDWLLKSGKSLASGSKIVCQRINGYWYVTESDNCPA